MSDARETAGIVAPPPLLFAAAVVVATVLDRRWPVALPAGDAARALGWIVAAAGLALELACVWQMRRAGTDARPWRPTTALVTGGAYRWSRNPIYVGLLVLTVGLALGLGNGWLLAAAAPLALSLHFAVVLREERYLSRRLGADYDRYRESVRRWL